MVAVPTEPGLGINLNRKVLQDLHENYQKCGITHRDDTSEMQKIEPGWEFKPTRW